MTYISLDPGKLQTLIDNLRTFQDQVYRSVETVYDDNRPHDYPLSLDLGTFYEWSDIDNECDQVSRKVRAFSCGYVGVGNRCPGC